MYSIIAGIVGLIFILIASVLHLLWNWGPLKEATRWRIKLERALKHGTREIVDEWVQRSLPLPVGFEEIEVELARVRKYENKLQRLRNAVIVAFYIGGTFLAILAVLLTVST